MLEELEPSPQSHLLHAVEVSGLVDAVGGEKINFGSSSILKFQNACGDRLAEN